VTVVSVISEQNMPGKTRTYSRLNREAVRLLGQQIKLGRKSRRMTEKELATRAGIARSTLQRIEAGDPLVEVGLVFEAAILAGVTLFDPGATTLAPQLDRIHDKLTLLPKAVRRRQQSFDDDF
jgi:transcriptional regulator with XRE-family HTH domain